MSAASCPPPEVSSPPTAYACPPAPGRAPAGRPAPARPRPPPAAGCGGGRSRRYRYRAGEVELAVDDRELELAELGAGYVEHDLHRDRHSAVGRREGRVQRDVV